MRVWGVVLAAIALFSLLFAGVTFHFWGQLAISAFALACLAFALDRSIPKMLRKWDGLSTLIWGLLSAAALYAAFFGAALAVKHILPVGSNQITQTSVYYMLCRLTKIDICSSIHTCWKRKFRTGTRNS